MQKRGTEGVLWGEGALEEVCRTQRLKSIMLKSGKKVVERVAMDVQIPGPEASTRAEMQWSRASGPWLGGDTHTPPPIKSSQGRAKARMRFLANAGGAWKGADDHVLLR